MFVRHFTPLKLYWLSPQREIYDLSQSALLPPQEDMFTTGRFLALYKVDEQEGLFQLNDVTFIKQSTVHDFSIPDGSQGIKLKMGFISTDFPFTKALVIDVLRETGFNVGHGNVMSGIVNEDTYKDIDRDLYVELPDNFDRSQLIAFVNGSYHELLPDPNSPNVFIRDGYHTLRLNRGEPRITFLDLSPLGEVKTLRISKDCLVSDPSHLTSGGIFHVPDVNLLDYTVCLINDGRLYLPNKGLSVTGAHSFTIDAGPLKSYSDFYRAPTLRRKVEFPYSSRTSPQSDLNDPTLGLWDKTNVQNSDQFLTPEFILDRLCSIHSALLLLPKGLFVASYMAQPFDEDPQYWVYPQEAEPNNSFLFSNGLISTPVFIKTGSHLQRSFLHDPFSADRYDQPADDPLRKVDYSPDRAMNKIRYPQRPVKLYSLMRFAATDQ